MITKLTNLIFNILALPYHIIVKIPWAVKVFARWFIEAIKETITQTFTLLGFFIAWLTLTGTAKDIVGIAILGSITLWLITIGLRQEKKEPKQKQSASR
jgi:hypothetical protein